ncbi:MAG: CoA-binding protein [Flavobacteriaceae bacterium CG_4_10_14_0_8_um_filter_31_99]|nr:MAG: CoA-binding protein [Flavobacteriaceae bacterium CG_4_8_14_3_um_filter_31_8]PIZ09439.1 MAG: CoA-binding protein [Flavobacteriaceae bacterium CG_4_10_14_0_8_um_filter_31_99]PJC09957.1 MAG: CoA-binding protein [Flavobacteriaceae bacterium CG_4_9_14_0_8_um_filter_31_91]
MENRTLVIGASLNPNRYSNIAIKRLLDKNFQVVALGQKKGTVLGVIIDDEKKQYQNIDTVTLYLNPERQKEYYDYIINLKPRRVIFNPGAENDEFVTLLKSKNIIAEVACTLVLLSIDKY